MPKVW